MINRPVCTSVPGPCGYQRINEALAVINEEAYDSELHDNSLANNKLRLNPGSGAKKAAVIFSSADNLTCIAEYEQRLAFTAGKGITDYHGSPCLADFCSDPLEDREGETSQELLYYRLQP